MTSPYVWVTTTNQSIAHLVPEDSPPGAYAEALCGTVALAMAASLAARGVTGAWRSCIGYGWECSDMGVWVWVWLGSGAIASVWGLYRGVCLWRQQEAEQWEELARRMMDRDIAEALDAAGVRSAALRCIAMDLHGLMSEISERCYAAGWMNGLEYRLWRAASDPDDDGGYGMGEIAEGAALMRLARGCGGWWAWHDDAALGPRFVPLADWKDEYQRHEEPA